MPRMSRKSQVIVMGQRKRPAPPPEGGGGDLAVNPVEVNQEEHHDVPVLFGIPISSRWTWEKLLLPLKDLISHD